MPATASIVENGATADDMARALHRSLEQYLADYPHAVVLEEGRVAFSQDGPFLPGDRHQGEELFEICDAHEEKVARRHEG